VFDPLPGQLPGGLLRLGVPEYGQARIDDAGIAAGGAEMQVELALAVTQQDHAGGHNRGPDRPARAACDGIGRGCLRVSFVLAQACAYLWWTKEGLVWVRAADFRLIWCCLG
jgi:hypothetical protein